MPSLLTATAVPRSDGQLRVRQGDARDDRRHADHRADAEAARARALAVTRLDGHHPRPPAQRRGRAAGGRGGPPAGGALPAAPPPIGPRMGRRSEMFDSANESTRLMTISPPMPAWNGSMPRARRSTNAAPIKPNTAPDAPTVVALKLSTSAPNEPASSAVK